MTNHKGKYMNAQNYSRRKHQFDCEFLAIYCSLPERPFAYLDLLNKKAGHIYRQCIKIIKQICTHYIHMQSTQYTGYLSTICGKSVAQQLRRWYVCFVLLSDTQALYLNADLQCVRSVGGETWGGWERGVAYVVTLLLLVMYGVSVHAIWLA